MTSTRWEGRERKVFNKLKHLQLPDSYLRTFDVGLTPNLEELRLGRHGNYYVKLHMSTICLNLRSLELYRIESRTFDLGLTPNLTSLRLEHSKFKRTLDIGLTPNLEVLWVECCDGLEELKMANESVKLKRLVWACSNLRTLDLGHCPNLESLEFTEFNVEEFRLDECPMLTYFFILHSKLRTLDLRQVPNLVELYLLKCRDLVELHLPSRCMNLNTLLCINSTKLRTLDLGVTPNLEKLDLKRCYNLVELHAPFRCLKNIRQLELSGCLGFSSLSVHIHDYTSTIKPIEGFPSVKLDFNLERCPFHPENNLPKFEFTSFHRVDLPSLTTSLEKLISKGPCSCAKFEAFSRSMCELQR